MTLNTNGASSPPFSRRIWVLVSAAPRSAQSPTPGPAGPCPTAKHPSAFLGRGQETLKKKNLCLTSPHIVRNYSHSLTASEWYFTQDLQKNSYQQKLQSQGHNNLEIISITFPRAIGFLLWCYPNNLWRNMIHLKKNKNGLRRGTVATDLCNIYGSSSQNRGTGKINTFPAWGFSSLIMHQV